MTIDDKNWNIEPQDLREVTDNALAQTPIGTLRLLYRCPAFCLYAVICFLGAKDILHGQSYSELGEFWGATAFTLHFMSAAFALLCGVNWVATYWNLNLFSQWFSLYGTGMVVRYLRGPVSDPRVMAGHLILATVGAFAFEIAAVLWLIRRRDAERLHRLKQVSKIVGLASAVAAFVWMFS